MTLDKEKNKGAVSGSILFKAFLFLVVGAGGVLVFSGKLDKAPLAADVLQIVDSVGTQDSQEIIQPELTPQDVPVESQNPVEEVEEPAPALQDASVEPQSPIVVEPAPAPLKQVNPAPIASGKVLVLPTVIPAGGEITVTVDASEISDFIFYVDIDLENVNTGSVIQGSLTNIDGEGKRFGSIPVPVDADQGAWIVKKASVIGLGETLVDYHDGQDMSATFTVASP